MIQAHATVSLMTILFAWIYPTFQNRNIKNKFGGVEEKQNTDFFCPVFELSINQIVSTVNFFGEREDPQELSVLKN